MVLVEEHGMTILPPRCRYWVALVLAVLVLALHLYLTLAVPFGDGLGLYTPTAVFGFLVTAIACRRRSLLAVARWVCFTGLGVCAVWVVLGIIGFFVYSMELIMLLVGGLAYAWALGIALAGVSEARKRVLGGSAHVEGFAAGHCDSSRHGT
jgi:hypothetical protein